MGVLSKRGGEILYNIVAKVFNVMQFVFVAWNGFWWNYHVGLAKMHDDRISELDPIWREKI